MFGSSDTPDSRETSRGTSHTGPIPRSHPYGYQPAAFAGGYPPAPPYGGYPPQAAGAGLVTAERTVVVALITAQ